MIAQQTRMRSELEQAPRAFRETAASLRAHAVDPHAPTALQKVTQTMAS